jgi:Fic family protein
MVDNRKNLNNSNNFQGKKHKRNKKTFGITHNPQMIALYNTVRGSTGSSDTLPSMPMYEYDLQSTIQSLEFLKQSLESYLNELSIRSLKITIDNEQQNDDEDIRDSALDTVSETSSLIEPIRQTLQSRLSTSSDEKKTLASSSSPPPPSSNHSDSKKDYQCTLTTVDELNSHFQPISISNPQMDRQISDEGYRSVQNEQQLQQGMGTISNHNSPLLTRSKSYDCTEKVGQWLSNTSPPPSSLPRSLTYHTDFQV